MGNYGELSLENATRFSSFNENVKDVDGFDTYNFTSRLSTEKEITITNKKIKQFLYDGVALHVKKVIFSDVYFDEDIISSHEPDTSFLISKNKNPIEVLRIVYHNKSFQQNSILSFYHFKIENFKILDYNNGGGKSKYKKISIFNPILLHDFLISGINLSELEISEFNPIFNSFELRDLEIDHLIIKNADLGKVIFNGVKIGKLTLENATLNDCIFNGVEFPNKLEDINSYKNQKDNYRQLKHVMEKNGNYTQANKFYAKEMEIYEELIGKENVFEKGWWKNFNDSLFLGDKVKLAGEKISLAFSKEISEFGGNWLRPLFLIFVLAFISTDIQYLYLNIDTLKIPNFTIHSFTPVYLFYELMFLLGIIFLIGWGCTKFFKKYIYWSIIIIGIIIHFGTDYKILSNFLDFLLPTYPFYGLKYETYQYLNTLEKTGFAIYKIIYGVLLWQMIVAIKRTTRR